MWRWIVNVVFFKAGWIICALACASENPLTAVVTLAVVAGVHLAWSADRWAVAAVLGIAAVIGVATDTLLIALDAIAFPDAGWMPPLAFVCFWVNYATLQTIAMRPLMGHWVLVSVFGLLGGPAAYYAGARLEALALPSGPWPGLLPVGVIWAVAAPFLLWTASRLTVPPGTHEGSQATRPPVEEIPTHAG